MASEDVIPTREELLPAFFHNIASKLPPYQASLGLTLLQVSTLVTDSTWVGQIFLLADQHAADDREITQYKNTELYGPRGTPVPAPPAGGPPIAISSVPVDIIGRLRDLIQQIKRSPNYTPTIGQDLGIIAPQPSPPVDEKPKLKAKAIGGFQASVGFNKAGHDGMLLEGRRAGELAWTPLAYEQFAPYIDTRPPLVPNQPEVRSYRGHFKDREGPAGGWSDEVSVTVGP